MLSTISTIHSGMLSNKTRASILRNVYGLPLPLMYIPIRDNAVNNYVTGSPDSTGITVANAPAITTGAVGTAQAIKFVQASTQYVKLPNINMANNPAFSVSFWVKLGATNATYANLWCISNYIKLNGTDATKKYTWAINMPSATTLRFEYARDGSEGTVRRGKEITVSTGVWFHIVVIQRANLNVDIYKNGTLMVSTVTGSNVTTAQNFAWTSNYHFLGRSSYASDPYINAEIDDFRFYSNYELTQANVNSLYDMRNNTKDIIN